VVADFGYDRAGSYLSGPGRGWLAGPGLPAVSREIVTDALAVTGGLVPVTDRIDGELRQHAKADPRVKTLTTLPGAGQFTALVMLAEIGDISRFPSARKLASQSGLTPTVRGSDLTVRHGHITRAGLGLAAVGHESGRPDRQAVPGILRLLRRHRQTPREEDRHHRDLPQAADPRLAPARHRPATGPGGTRRQHGHRSTPPDREGHQAPGELALAA
jgi:transposase